MSVYFQFQTYTVGLGTYPLEIRRELLYGDNVFGTKKIKDIYFRNQYIKIIKIFKNIRTTGHHVFKNQLKRPANS